MPARRALGLDVLATPLPYHPPAKARGWRTIASVMGSDLSREQIEGENLLMRRLLTTEGYDALLDVVVEESLEALRAERGFLALAKGDEVEFKVVRNWSRDELQDPEEGVSRSILRAALAAPGPLLVEDALSDPRFGHRKSVLKLQVRSVLAAPVVVDESPIGVLYLETSRLTDLFDGTSLAAFERILEVSSRAVQGAARRLHAEERATMLETNVLAKFQFPGIVTQDAAMMQVLETVGHAAATELPVLVQGASGTGKELVLRALHLNSKRAAGPCLTLNCGAIAPGLLESELFGHRRGSYTGATSDKTGLLCSADGGTIVLDEIGELPLELQAKLLRTLQFGEVHPIGAMRPVAIDVRFLAATNKRLDDEARAGRFRQDLLYRLNAITVELPALWQRPGDILLLFHHFLRQECARLGRAVPDVDPGLEHALERHDWPGNVRELENEARRSVGITPPGTPLTADRLSPRVVRADGTSPSPTTTLADTERVMVESALEECGGNRTAAARRLGISRETLRRKLKSYGLG